MYLVPLSCLTNAWPTSPAAPVITIRMVVRSSSLCGVLAASRSRQDSLTRVADGVPLAGRRTQPERPGNPALQGNGEPARLVTCSGCATNIVDSRHDLGRSISLDLAGKKSDRKIGQ